MFKGHPRGLKVLFFSEMWERFGIYTMLAIFTLYMGNYFGWPDDKKGQIYGLFLALVYFSPVLGGYLADKFWGFPKTIKIGAILTGIGYAILAIPKPSELLFYTGLFVVAMSNGLFKANISVMVGNLYEKNSPLKDSGYNIFYMGINIGAFLAPIVATFLRNSIGIEFGYNAGFGAAATGMLLSFITFRLGQASYQASAAQVASQSTGTVQTEEYVSPKKEKDRVIALIIVYLIVVFFWMSFHQNGFALTLFADRSTRPMDLPDALRGVLYFILGISDPANASEAEFYQVFNPMFILLLTPLVIKFWGYLNARGQEPATPAKIGFGMFICGLGFAIMIVASSLGGDADAKSMSPLWLISSYFVQTLAELCLSPMGLSYASKMAPYRWRGLLMGGWFAATAIGNYLAGFLGSFYSTWSHTLFYTVLTICCFFSALMIVIFLKKLKRAAEPEAVPVAA